MRVWPSTEASTSYSTSSALTSTRQKSQGAPQPLPPHMRPGMALRRAATVSLPDRCSGVGSFDPAGCDPIMMTSCLTGGRSSVRPGLSASRDFTIPLRSSDRKSFRREIASWGVVPRGVATRGAYSLRRCLAGGFPLWFAGRPASKGYPVFITRIFLSGL